MNPESITGSKKILNSTIVSNINNKWKHNCFQHEYQIGILECYLKDHVTLKTGVCWWKFSFDQITAGLMTILDHFQKP